MVCVCGVVLVCWGKRERSSRAFAWMVGVSFYFLRYAFPPPPPLPSSASCLNRGRRARVHRGCCCVWCTRVESVLVEQRRRMGRVVEGLVGACVFIARGPKNLRLFKHFLFFRFQSNEILAFFTGIDVFHNGGISQHITSTHISTLAEN